MAHSSAESPPMLSNSTILPTRSQTSDGVCFGEQMNSSSRPADTKGHEPSNSAAAMSGVEHGTLGTSPGTPSEAAKGAKSGIELLRRLSLMEGRPTLSAMARPEEHADLRLTGRIISASFCIPYKLRFRSGLNWDADHGCRNCITGLGTSALFDSFPVSRLIENPWSHTLVGVGLGEVENFHSNKTHIFQAGHIQALVSSRYHWKLPMTLPKQDVPPPIPVDGSHKPQLRQMEFTSKKKTEIASKSNYTRFGSAMTPSRLKKPCTSRTKPRWRRYAEREIYPLFHYKQHGPTDGRAERRWWQDYQRMNQLFADLNIGDLSSRRYCLDPRLPFVLVAHGVLGSNMIGFQSFTYSRHFSSCCTRILRFDSNSAGIDAYGAHVAVDVFPIGIDVDAVRKMAYGEPNIEKTIAEIKKLYAGKKIIIGRDRLDSARGVTQKLIAFEMFLERYPEWRDKVVLIQVTSPTSVEEEKEESEAKLSSQMSHLVSTINGRYGSLSFSPVQHYPQYLSRHEYFALLRAADVGLITSVRDGMNTTSLEYVVCQHENHGPLILSEFSGTAGSLHNAIHINPWDSGGVAAAINEALTMSYEQREEQHEALYKYVTTHTVSIWSDLYIGRLLNNLSSFNQSIATPVLDKAKLLYQYRKARRRLFMFDYDGTLTPIVKDPQAAIPSDRVVRTLKSLAADPKNSVWIISGRDQNFLEEWMGHISELGLSAEHGCFIRKPHNEVWENLTEKSNMGWQKEVLDIFQHYTERTQGSFIERKRVALTWHYRRVDPEYGAYQAKECRKHLENTVARKWDVEIMAGKANLEVRPTFVNKGEIASRLVNECQGRPEFVLCLGDDFTDEDMFRALRHSNLPKDRVFAVTVGASSKQTEASWHLLEPADVIATISLLNSCN
ncbi:trehalose-phosphatase [Coccidioides immitis RMSCC 3703]|uniref:Trehalose-phosphatase n=1 Tax=Coccidioides immitis RMSCC 3703 TaxID=454286 RepID=A0A0J8U3X9_COCIT|nr:trehalose-phosphatase [Coccidioides immitis RMSCC 3703]